jgi:hypothetical protein
MNFCVLCQLHADVQNFYFSPDIGTIKSRRMSYTVTQRMRVRFWWGITKERKHFGDQGVDEKLSLKWVLKEIGRDGVSWICLAPNGDHWRSFVTTAMNVRAGAVYCREIFD